MSLEFKLKDKCKEGRLDIQSVGGNKLFWDRSPYVAQAGLKREVLLPLFPKYCGYRVYLAVCGLLYLAEPTGLAEIPVGIKIEEGGLRTAVPIAPVTWRGTR